MRYLLTNLLRPESNTSDKELAFQNLREMARLQPNRPSLYSITGSVYFRLWLAGRDEVDRQRASAAYNRYLQLTPRSDLFRAQAQRLIDMLKMKH